MVIDASLVTVAKEPILTLLIVSAHDAVERCVAMLSAGTSAVIHRVDASSNNAFVLGARHTIRAIRVAETAHAAQRGVAFQAARAIRGARFEAAVMLDAAVDGARDAVRAIRVHSTFQTAQIAVAEALVTGRVEQH